MLSEMPKTRKSYCILITPGTEWSNMIIDLKEIDNSTLIIGSLEDQNYIVKNLSDVYEKKNLHSFEILLCFSNPLKNFLILPSAISRIKITRY